MLKKRVTFFYVSIVLVLAIIYSQIAKSDISFDTYKVTCAGIEVMGVDRPMADEIRKLSAMQIGDVFMFTEANGYCKKSTEQIKNKFSSTEDVKCSYMALSNGEFYFVLDIIPLDSRLTTYREIPKSPHKVAELPVELVSLYKQLYERRFELMYNHLNHEEYYDKGYLDFDDPVMHTIADQLSVLAKKHNDDLLNIIHYSQDADEREIAGLLLSWSQHPSNLRYIAQADFLLDPNNAVRNNVARSYIHFMERVEDITLLSDIMPAYCKMAALPLHSDRNKALYSILEILKTHNKLSSVIDEQCKNTITYIAEMSILEDVGGVAQQILKLIEDEDNA